MGSNGRGRDITVLINHEQLKSNASTFKSIYEAIEVKKGITAKSSICFDLLELANKPKGVSDTVSLTYNNSAFVKQTINMLTKLEIKHEMMNSLSEKV